MSKPLSKEKKAMERLDRLILAARLPSLPGWEQLLASLHALPESRLNKEDLRFELLLLVTDPNLDYETLLEKLAIFLPRVTEVELVAVLQLTNQTEPVLTSNCAHKHVKILRQQAEITQQITNGKSVRHHLRRAVRLPNRSKPLTYLTVDHLPDTPSGPLIFLTASPINLLPSELKVLQVIVEILRLRGDQIRLKSRVTQEAARFSTLTHHLNEGMAVLNRDLTVSIWNQALTHLTGYSRREAVNQPYTKVLPRLDQGNWLIEMHTEARTTGRQSFSQDFQLLTKQKHKKWINVSVSFLWASEGRDKTALDQVIIIVRDISYIKELEQRKNEFISIATHELRTPITAIMGYLSLLTRERAELTEKQDLYLSRASEATKRLVRLAEDLLRVVQVEEDRLLLNLKTVAVYPMLATLVRDFTPRAQQKGLKLQLKKPDFPTKIIADEERLQQIFSNLIDNALKYTTRGHVDIICERFVGRDNRPRLRVLVRDTGIGIEGKKLNEIFEKFQRSHRPEQVRELGAGLGLFIVRSFITKLGGEISVRSRPGRGTTFYVIFPMVENRATVKNR